MAVERENGSHQAYALVILGAGKAGLTLALQLRRKDPNVRIAIIEKYTYPVPESAHKVGESTVEMSARYFRQELGLQGILQQEHLPKCGLRFFFSAGNNDKIEERVEMGHFTWPLQPSDQIDRGRFENRLASLLREECVDVFDGWKVEDVELNDEMSSVTIQNGEESKILETAWVVDATGRSSYLKRKLDLEQDIKHSCSSVWFRIDARITLDEWAEGDAWEWPMQMRYLATNHLMGEGYWVWLIPLSSGATSVGIVFDETFIPFDEVSTHEKAIVWLEKNEPQCAAKLRELEAECLDFRVMRKYARQTKAFFGSPRWALTGEAGSFIDPLYSSGADFIAMANTMICDLVLRERRGEDVTMRMEVLNNLLSRIFDSFVDLFRKQYGVLGHAQAMVAKIVWDFAVYWAFTCPLFFQGKLTDLAFLERLRDLSERTHYLNKTVQRFFQRWSKHEQREWTNQRIDYGKIQFMQGLLYNLTIPYEEDRLEEVLHDNLRLLQTVAMHFIEVAQEHCEPLRKYPSLTPEYAIQPAGAPTDADWVPRHLNTHLSVREDLKRIWLT